MTPNSEKPTPDYSYPKKFPPVTGYPIPLGSGESMSPRLFPEYARTDTPKTPQTPNQQQDN